jgi:hypothetical protein
VGTFEKVWASFIKDLLDRTCGSELEFSCMTSCWGEDLTRRRLAAGDDGIILDFLNPRNVRKQIARVFFVFCLFICFVVL